MEGSSSLPKLRRNASASANINNLATHCNVEKPGLPYSNISYPMTSELIKIFQTKSLGISCLMIQNSLQILFLTNVVQFFVVLFGFDTVDCSLFRFLDLV